MTDEDIERIITATDKKVADKLEFSEKTKLRVSIKNAVAIIGSIIIGTTAVCTFLYKISTSQDRVETALSYMVPESQFTNWANALYRANQKIPLDVPDTSQYRAMPRQPITGSEPSQ